MVFRKISKDIKDRAMHLYSTGWLPFDIVKVLGVSERSFWRWRKNLAVRGTVLSQPLPVPGRRPILTTTAAQDLYNLLEEYPSMYLDEIQQWLIIAHDIGMAKSTFHQNLRDLTASSLLYVSAPILRFFF